MRSRNYRKPDGSYDFKKFKKEYLKKKEEIKDVIIKNRWIVDVTQKTNKTKYTPMPMRYVTNEPKYNFLKYYRVVRVWAAKAHNLSSPDLELLLYLNGEGIFSKVYITDYNKSIDWTRTRFESLLEKGWLTFYRHSFTSSPDKAALYKLSRKGKLMCSSLHRKLLLLEKIPPYSRHNPEYASDQSNYAKQHRKQVKKFNEAVDKKNNTLNVQNEIKL
jgi:hypothetical protein